MVPKPTFPKDGIKTNCSLEIPIEETPILSANVGYTGVEVLSCVITLNALTPKRLLPSP